MDTIKDKISKQFQYPIGKTSFKLYFAMLNEQGKLTSRSMMDTLVAICEYLEEKEQKS